MREFKFRGKKVEDGEWIYGDLLTGQFHGAYIVTFVDDASRKLERLNYSEVYPNTIGMAIGMEDDAGNAIYEGDFVKVGMADEDEIFKIGWDLERFKFVLIEVYDSDPKEGYGFSASEQIKVIGNIYDTPELGEGNGKQYL